MGWKSTINITREEAKTLIIQKLVNLDQMSDRDLINILDDLGYGEDPNLKYYGHNFIIE